MLILRIYRVESLKLSRYAHIDRTLKLGHSFHFGQTSLVLFDSRNCLFDLLFGHLHRFDARFRPNHVIFHGRHGNSSAWTKSGIAWSQNPFNNNNNQSYKLFIKMFLFLCYLLFTCLVRPHYSRCLRHLRS